MKATTIIIILSAGMIFFACNKPFFQHEQQPFVLKQYYQGGWIGGHATWWWNVYISGKKFKLPDGEADFRECYIGPAKEPPNFSVKTQSDFYMIRVIDNKPEIILMPPSAYARYGWTNDGLGFVFKDSMLDISTGQFSAIKPFPGDFLGYSPDKKRIVSLIIDMSEYKVCITDQSTGQTEKHSYDLKEYRWLGQWNHFTKTEYAPNIWIFNHIQWKRNERNEYDMIIPKNSEIK